MILRAAIFLAWTPEFFYAQIFCCKFVNSVDLHVLRAIFFTERIVRIRIRLLGAGYMMLGSMKIRRVLVRLDLTGTYRAVGPSGQSRIKLL